MPLEVKQERNNHLLGVQSAISEEDNQRFIGTSVDVLVEGPSKRALKKGEEDGPLLQLTGRTHCDRIVVFEGNRRQVGHILPVAIYEATANTLFGEVVTQYVGPQLHSLQPA